MSITQVQTWIADGGLTVWIYWAAKIITVKLGSKLKWISPQYTTTTTKITTTTA